MLRRLRDLVGECRFGLATADARTARRTARQLASQLDDYLRPRLDQLNGPLLMVVCGPTGAGKSTLVNSLVQAPVSHAGALRPTTRAPVLVANPADASWFTRYYLLPTFARTSGSPEEGRHLQVIAAPALPPGLALLDAPDIDSVAADNRDLAAELMGAADLWLFVTTANRYADEAPWTALRSARERGTQLALVLDRIPDRADVVRRHLTQMLFDEELDESPVFELPESPLDPDGLLPEHVLAPLRDWFEQLVGDVTLRSALARQTLDGAVATLPARVRLLADESAEQHRYAERLRAMARSTHRAATSSGEDAIQHGGLLAGELRARWDELVAGGELLRAVGARSGRLRDHLNLSRNSRAVPGREVVPVVEAALTALLRETLADAARRTDDGWRETPVGAALLSDVGADDADPEKIVTDWVAGLLDLVRDDSGQRSVSRQTPYTLHAVRLLVLVAVLIAPARADADGTERDLIDTVLADPVVRRIADTARKDLLDRFRQLTDAQRRRYDTALNRVASESSAAGALREVAAAIPLAHADAALVTEWRLMPPAYPEPAEQPAAEVGPLIPAQLVSGPALTGDLGALFHPGRARDSEPTEQVPTDEVPAPVPDPAEAAGDVSSFATDLPPIGGILSEADPAGDTEPTGTGSTVSELAGTDLDGAEPDGAELAGTDLDGVGLDSTGSGDHELAGSDLAEDELPGSVADDSGAVDPGLEESAPPNPETLCAEPDPAVEADQAVEADSLLAPRDDVVLGGEAAARGSITDARDIGLSMADPDPDPDAGDSGPVGVPNEALPSDASSTDIAEPLAAGPLDGAELADGAEDAGPGDIESSADTGPMHTGSVDEPLSTKPQDVAEQGIVDETNTDEADTDEADINEAATEQDVPEHGGQQDEAGQQDVAGPVQAREVPAPGTDSESGTARPSHEVE